MEKVREGDKKKGEKEETHGSKTGEREEKQKGKEGRDA